MALMKCPECENNVSDKADKCVHCGFSIKEYLLEEKKQNTLVEMFKCVQCGFQNEIGSDYCSDCGARITDYKDSTRVLGTKKEIDYSTIPYTICPNCGSKNQAGEFKCSTCGYKYTMNDYEVVIPKTSKKTPCPNCGGTNYHAFVEEVLIREGKVKARTTLNLNPFRPFAVFNHKEKVVRQPITIQVSKFVCDDCGQIFQ